MPAIRAVLFDADGVIQYASGEDLPSRLRRALNFVPEDIDAFVAEVFEAERRALIGQADFAQHLEPVLSKWGVPPAAGAALARAWWCAIEADPAVLALIGQLRAQGIFCALASNQQRYRAAYMGETLGYDQLFDRCFYSCQLGCMKPDLRFFRTVAASLAFAPAEVLFIDDVEQNVRAAREVGLHAEQFVHPRDAAGVALLRQLLARYSVTPNP